MAFATRFELLDHRVQASQSLAFCKSTVMRTSPGITLREFGFTCRKPTVPRA